MNIKIKFPLDDNSYTDARLPALSLLALIISFGTLAIDSHLYSCRRSFLLSSEPNKTLPSYQFWCKISYDQCRCSVLTNKSNDSIKCITDLEAMSAHIIPLVSYVLQLYVVSKLFSFTGMYSHILTDIFWVIVLLTFILVAFRVHGSSCANAYTNDTIFMTSGLICGSTSFLMIFSRDFYSESKFRNIDRNQILTTNENDRKMLSTVVVS